MPKPFAKWKPNTVAEEFARVVGQEQERYRIVKILRESAPSDTCTLGGCYQCKNHTFTRLMAVILEEPIDFETMLKVSEAGKSVKPLLGALQKRPSGRTD